MDENAFSHGLESGRMIKMSHANRRRTAAQAVSSRFHARHPNQEFKPDFSLQTRWRIGEGETLVLFVLGADALPGVPSQADG